ncbi:hypothetical protein OGAPHI_001543 [Ogataea philodendri]|uniref:Uncharacterized protein n=1 Tax=Ogataea philodendri TaxID=1378263 RepID=A0A9P8PCF4_9ASCO|nr:uncharacterized protein OGAPHI_001543 [Ogataea philodendri]KAH3669422.1 hypothetical protein OGAPHI_001543 [Ogataea philodendri]
MAVFCILNNSAQLVDQTNNRTLELGWRRHHNVHDWFQHNGLGTHKRLFERELRGSLERQLRRVHHVSLTIVNQHVHSQNTRARQWTLLDALVESLLTGQQILLWDLTSNNLGLEVIDEPDIVLGSGSHVLRIAHGGGLELSHHLGVLTGTSRLLLVGVLERSRAQNGFSVRNAWPAHCAVHVVLTAHSLDVDLQMELAHSADDGLLGVLVVVDSESRVFFLEPVHSFREIHRVGGLRCDRQRNNSIRNVHRRHGVVDLAVGEGISRRAVDTERCADFSSSGLVHVLHVVRVHSHEPGNLDLLARLDVGDHHAFLQTALVNTQLLTLTALEIDALTVDDVHHTAQILLGSNRHLNSSSSHLELRVDLLHTPPRISAHSIHLVNESDSWNVVSLHLSIHSDCLRLHTGNSTNHQNSSVQNPQRSLDLDREINMARGVDQVEMVVLVVLVPGTVGCSRLDGDTFLSFEIHMVHLGSNTVFSTNVVDRLDPSRVEQHTLGERGLARVDMGGNTNVPHLGQPAHVRLGQLAGQPVQHRLLLLDDVVVAVAVEVAVELVALVVALLEPLFCAADDAASAEDTDAYHEDVSTVISLE